MCAPSAQPGPLGPGPLSRGGWPEPPARRQWLPTRFRPRIQTQSCEASKPPIRKGVTLAYSALHEYGHDFVSKEHSLAGQAEAWSVAPQAAGFEKRLEVGAKPAPDVNSVARLYGIYIDPVNQPQSGEQGVPQLLGGGQVVDVDRGQTSALDALHVLRRGRQILPARAAARRVRAAAETEPLAVGPVLEVMPRSSSRPRAVRDLVLRVPRRVEPLHRRQVHRRDIIVWRLRPPGARHLVA